MAVIARIPAGTNFAAARIGRTLPRKLQCRSDSSCFLQDFPSKYIFHSWLLRASVQVNLSIQNQQHLRRDRCKMQISLVSSILSIFWMASPSSCGLLGGQIWGGSFKPIGLNTIIRNRCLAEDWQGVLNQRGREEGESMAELVEDMAGQVTSRAVLALLHRARGHKQMITCSQRQLNKMERNFGACVRKVQYQIRCKSATPHQRCTWVQAFVQTCTKEILGQCLSEEVVESISGRQRRYMRKSGLEGRVCTSKTTTSSHNEVLKGPEHPLQISYNDYLKSVLSQL